MTSAVEITVPFQAGRDRLGTLAQKGYTAYPIANNFVNLNDEGDDDDIQSYMARARSPIRVTFTPSNMGMKRKSRVTDAARSAIFNYRPLRKGDQISSVFRFRSPDATLPTLQYLSPWISVTKTDYKDPRLSTSDSSEYSSGLFRRSYTEACIETRRKNTPALSRDDFDRKSELLSQQRPRTFGTTRENSAKSSSTATEKRVKIFDPKVDDLTEFDVKPTNNSISPSFSTKLADIKPSESGINYYSGYLPPELSDEIADKLKLTSEPTADENSENKDSRYNFPTQYLKPLVGDRTMFMHGSYPTQPKILHSNIDQLRLQGRQRLLRSNGQAPTHFSAFKDRGTLARPKQKGAHLDEAVREQHRQTQTQTVKCSRHPGQATSLEVFQQQRDRTYNLQKKAREMINK